MVPKLVDALEGQWIVIQRVPGTPYLDCASFDACLLARAIAGFHLSTLQDGQCVCHIDNQPANILLNADCVYLLDFSDSRIAAPELDITHLLLFWAADMPPFRFIECTRQFMDSYTAEIQLSSKLWSKCLLQSMEAFDARRARFGKPGGKNEPLIQRQNRELLSTLLS